jgi:P27 family predicted phage terminase small subunit
MSEPERATIPISTKPQCPPDVPPEVSAEFARVVALLGSRAAPSDSDAILMYCTAWCTWRGAQATVAREGRVVSIGGTVAPHPALSIASQAHRELLVLAKELGLTPLSRGKIKVDDELEQLLQEAESE